MGDDLTSLSLYRIHIILHDFVLCSNKKLCLRYFRCIKWLPFLSCFHRFMSVEQ